MAQSIDWLQSRATMCKVNFYSPDGQKDQERKVICFVDVSNLNSKDRNLDAPSHSLNILDPARNLDLANLEEKEIIVIKDNDQSSRANTEGAVCLFKQGRASEDVNVVSWLSSDLQKYATGFQHVLTPLGASCKPNMFDSSITYQASQNNNNTASNASGGQTGNLDDISYYANKLCSFVFDMTRKELRDKLETSGKFIRHKISSYSPEGKLVSSECADSSRPPHGRATKRDDPFLADSFKLGDSFSDKPRRHDDISSVNKRMMLYANQVASDVMLSFLKTMTVQKGKQTPTACTVLKEVFMKHTKEIVSDLIDSSMKNLHNVTGALMTDSDFVTGLKKNLYVLGTQKTTEVLEVMVKRLFKLLSDDKVKAQSLAFAAFKSGTQSNQKSQAMQFASLKSEVHGQGKDRGGGPGKSLASGSKGPERPASLDVYAKDILLTALMQIQQHLLEKSKESGPRESNTSSFGYIHRDSNRDRAGGSPDSRHSAKSWEGKSDYRHSDVFKEKGSIILSLIQKILRDACSNADESSGDTNRAREPGYSFS